MPKTREIYVVLTQTNTLLASTIRRYTRQKYSHVSVGFNLNCRDMYSFGRKHYYNPIYGIFKKENIGDRIFSGKEENMMAVYRLEVTNKELRQIKRNIRSIRELNDGFNVLGLALAAFNIKLERNKYYCAEFVHEAIHESTGLLEESENAIRPEDIIRMNDSFELVYEGSIQDFLGHNKRLERQTRRKRRREARREACRTRCRNKKEQT